MSSERKEHLVTGKVALRKKFRTPHHKGIREQRPALSSTAEQAAAGLGAGGYILLRSVGISKVPNKHVQHRGSLETSILTPVQMGTNATASTCGPTLSVVCVPVGGSAAMVQR